MTFFLMWLDRHLIEDPKLEYQNQILVWKNLMLDKNKKIYLDNFGPSNVSIPL
jgi:hypothetical protein